VRFVHFAAAACCAASLPPPAYTVHARIRP
jgi:hypothetical protein